MFAENHGVIAWLFDVEKGVAEIGVGETPALVKLPLDSAAVTGIAGVLGGAALHAKEIVRDVFDGIESETVRFGPIHEPANIADEKGPDILFVEVGVGGDDFLGESVGGAETDIGPVGQFVVVLGVVRVTDKRVFLGGAALGEAEVGVGSFVGDIDQVGQTEVLYLPGGAPVAAVIPFPIETVFGFFQVKVLWHHAGIGVDGCALVVSRNIKGAVVHDVVEVDANAEAVGDFHHVQQFGFGSVAGAVGAFLVF